MAVPEEQVKKHIHGALNRAIHRVQRRADELFSSEIASGGNGTSSPFQKMLFPEAKIFSSFERSLSASLGKAFDYIAADIAKATYGNGEHDYRFAGSISTETLAQIESIVASYKAKSGIQPQTEKELEKLGEVIESSNADLRRELKSDVFFIDHEGYENYLEIKTPMPNYDTCAAVKTRILTVYALRHGASNPVRALVVFPHNPNGLVGEYAWPPSKYFLDPTRDWYAKGKRLMGPGLWNFIGNSDDTYDELLECFYQVSLERKEQLSSLLMLAGI